MARKIKESVATVMIVIGVIALIVLVLHVVGVF